MTSLLVALSTAALLAGPVGATVAQAQTVPSNRMVQARGHVHADGRCHGISYGTGARRCGTASGGPVGGISGRN